VTCVPPRVPLYDPRELRGVIPTDPRKPFDVREIIARIVDGSGCSTSSRPATAPPWSPASRTSKACRWASSPTTASCSAKAR
jgi:hypothetical protein